MNKQLKKNIDAYAAVFMNPQLTVAEKTEHRKSLVKETGSEKNAEGVFEEMKRVFEKKITCLIKEKEASLEEAMRKGVVPEGVPFGDTRSLLTFLGEGLFKIDLCECFSGRFPELLKTDSTELIKHLGFSSMEGAFFESGKKFLKTELGIELSGIE